MTQKLCPLCKKLVVSEHQPFCSKACKTRDLHRWLNEVYVIPTNEKADENKEPEDTH